jgi:menaquinone-dependent protoporphyrinogen IX oxidase
MKILVTYKSKTEFTKRYAEIIAKEVEGELIDFSKVTSEKMSEYDVVVYGGGLHAGKINGFKKAKDIFSKSAAKKMVVFVTGATPNEEAETIDEVWKVNLTEEEMESVPHFYMQSGLCYEKMSFPDKTLMKLLANMLSKKKNKSNAELGQEEAIKNSYNIADEKYAKPLIEYLLGE